MPNDPVLQEMSKAALVNPPLMRTVGHDDDVSFIPMADVSESGQWIGNQTRKQHEVSVGYTPFEEGDVLFAKITPCMENGKGCHAVGLVNGVGYGSTEFHVLRARAGTDSRFLYYWSTTEAVRKKAEAFMIGSAGQQRVQASFFDYFCIPRLEKEEQRFVVRILDAADEAIAKTGALIAKLKAIKQGLLHDLLTRGLDGNGALRDPERHPEYFKDSVLGCIPAAWDIGGLGAICAKYGGSIQTGPFGSQLHAADYVRDGTPIITVEHLGEGTILHQNLPRVSDDDCRRLSRYRLQEGDLVFSRVGAIDRCARVRTEEDGWLFSGRCLRVRPGQNGMDSFFLVYQLNGFACRRWIVNHAVGSTMRCLNTTILGQLPVTKPPPEEQKQIGHILSASDNRIALEENHLSKLAVCKKGLMQDLLTGRVRAYPKVEA